MNSYPEKKDQELVLGVQQDDKLAFDLLVIKCQHKIIHLVDRYVKDINEAQDVAQETQTQPELKDTLKCYAVVSHALKTKIFYGFQRVSETLCK